MVSVPIFYDLLADKVAALDFYVIIHFKEHVTNGTLASYALVR